MKFKINSQYKLAGDQPQAVEKLVTGLNKGYKHQTLMGVTGSGKTFSIAKVIEKVQKPTLVIAHNKTLAAQLTSEFRSLFPQNAVEYFVSYYDYYQPEAYMPKSDVYIEKEVEINKEIERLRHAATQALLSRNDVIIVASVSCIYGLGSPEVYKNTFLEIVKGEKISRDDLLKKLVDLYFTRSEILERGRFRVHGNIMDIIPISEEKIIRIEFANDIVSKITELENLTMNIIAQKERIYIYSAKHFVVDEKTINDAVSGIKQELHQRLKELERAGKLLEAERLNRRTNYDLEMLAEVGYCNGIENYSRYLTGRKAGEAPYTLMDFFPRDYLLIVDESHVTIPQIRGMFEGDRARKENLVEHGFRLPSAYDNRPLKFPEFEKKVGQAIYTTATPSVYEKQHSSQIVEQIIRPTGLVDPELEIRPTLGQVDNLIEEILNRVKNKERVLVTTLTKRMAEDLSEHLKERKIKTQYLHSEVDTLDRVNILEDLRKGEFDCLVGVNLLREGLDLPEVSLVAIFDADKEGFLRSQTSLIQTIGRAARNVSGKVIMYADNITDSMKKAISETSRRRKIQIEYNVKHHITPKTIKKAIESIVDRELKPEVPKEFIKIENLEDLPRVIRFKQEEMKKLASNLQFEQAAILRDEIIQLKKLRFK